MTSGAREQLRAFHEPNAAASWRRLLVTLVLLAGAWALTISPLPYGLRVVASFLTAGCLLRLCTFGHDWAHGAILKDSRLAALVIQVAGCLVLAPVRVWKDTHNHHHANNARLNEPAIGSFELWSDSVYRSATRSERLSYRLGRSPLVMLLAWPLVFIIALNSVYFVRNPRRYHTSLLALVLHVGLNIAAWSLGGWTT